jgi:hypothetical protein
MTSVEKTPVILDADPCLDGAVAWILPGRSKTWVPPTLPAIQTADRRYDAAGMVDPLKADPVDLAILEAVSAAPVAGRVQGTASMFGFGRGLRIWEGILAALAIPTWPSRPRSGSGRSWPGRPGTSRRRSRSPRACSPASRSCRPRAAGSLTTAWPTRSAWPSTGADCWRGRASPSGLVPVGGPTWSSSTHDRYSGRT